MNHCGFFAKRVLMYGILIFIFSICIGAGAQTTAALYQSGLKLESQYHFKEALPVFESLLKSDSSDARFLANTAFLYAKVIHDNGSSSEAQRTTKYNLALYLAKRAIRADSNNAEAYYALAFAIGVLNENAGNKQQIANAKTMKTEIDKCLKLNPRHAGAQHLLGRWYRRLAELSGLERFAMKTFYGSSLPQATYADAIKSFEEAYINQPDYILHQYEMAVTYHDTGKDADAKIWLNMALKANYNGDDATDTKIKCQKLLNEIK